MIPAGVEGLHPETQDLVNRFSAALASKLRSAEEKYGYSDGWRRGDWMDECRAKLREHIDKGDPRDVAAYCAFLWHHGESTASACGGVPAAMTNNQQEPTTEGAERANFEAWVIAENQDYDDPASMLEHNSNGDYSSIRINGAWLGWLARSRTAAPAGQWQPIETLPEWETALLFVPREACLARIVRGRKLSRSDGIVWEIEGTSAHETLMRQQKWATPTHWMPLPGAPK